jgi:hypothetical protein
LTLPSLLFAGENRKVLHEQEAEKMLIVLLTHEFPEVQAAAAQAIGVMCENLSVRDAIREWGKRLILMLMNENDEKEKAK